jgi:hypothetical protein
MSIIIITCRLVLDIRAHMHTGSDVTHGPHIRTALPMEHRKWATQRRRTVDDMAYGLYLYLINSAFNLNYIPDYGRVSCVITKGVYAHPQAPAHANTQKQKGFRFTS